MENQENVNQNPQNQNPNQKQGKNFSQKSEREVNSERFTQDKEIDLDRSGYNVGGKEQSLQNTKDVPTGGGSKQAQQQGQAGTSRSGSQSESSGTQRSGNKSDIDEEAYKFGKEKGDVNKQSGGGEDRYGSRQNQRSGNLGNQQEQDDSRRV